MRTTITSCTLLAVSVLCAASGAMAQVAKPVTSATPITTAPMPAATVGQTITLNNTTYVVNAKEQLTTGMEYYTMVPSALKAKPVNFLRTNNRYNATVFTPTQYRTFLATGKLPSFGTLLETISGTDTLLHANIGGTVAVMVATGRNELVMFEFINGAQTMAMTTGKIPQRPKVSPNQYSSCVDRCRSTRTSCEGNAGSQAGKDRCWDVFGLCVAGCSVMVPQQPVSIHVIRTTVPLALN